MKPSKGLSTRGAFSSRPCCCTGITLAATFWWSKDAFPLMHLELNIKYCVFFSNKTPLRDSCLLVLARTFALLSVTPSSAVKLCCRPNLCEDLSLVKQKKTQPNFLPRAPDMVLAQAPSRTRVRRSLRPEKACCIALILIYLMRERLCTRAHARANIRCLHACVYL